MKNPLKYLWKLALELVGFVAAFILLTVAAGVIMTGLTIFLGAIFAAILAILLGITALVPFIVFVVLSFAILDEYAGGE